MVFAGLWNYCGCIQLRSLDKASKQSREFTAGKQRDNSLNYKDIFLHLEFHCNVM
jgi:hypothetical protein